jgi:hypothetical protein
MPEASISQQRENRGRLLSGGNGADISTFTASPCDPSGDTAQIEQPTGVAAFQKFLRLLWTLSR